MSTAFSPTIHSKRRKLKEQGFKFLTLLAALLAVASLIFLMWGIIKDGKGAITADFFKNFSSRFPDKAGIKGSLIGTVMVMVITMILAVPTGVAAAIYLEEFASKRSKLNQLLQINIANLAGIPSIVYGLLGLSVFVYMLNLGKTVLAASLTMALLILPLIIVVSQEALRAVPRPLREGSLALGATPWQTVRRQVLPTAIPGIITGVILSASRAIGETAPLIVVGAVTSMFKAPSKLDDPFTVLPIQIFDWSSRPKVGFQETAAAASIVLLVTLIVMNAAAIWIRAKYEKQL